MNVTELLGIAALLFGVFFCLVGITGIVRLPDVYSRIHASGKITVLGVNGLLVGAAFLLPGITLKALTLGLFLVITSAAASYAVANAAYRQGVPPSGLLRNDLAERDQRQG
jgi:multicomponent Na+:H+ antiporter subunit G